MTTAAPNSGKMPALSAAPGASSEPVSDVPGSQGGAPPPFPLLVVPERAQPAGRRFFFDIPNRRFSVYLVPSAATYRCVASGHGWLVLAAVNTPRSIVLLNPVTQGRVDVEWPFGNHYIDRLHAVLTSSPRDRECLLAVASDWIVAYCRPCRDRPWAGWHTLRAAGFRYDAAASDFVCVGTTVYLVDEWRMLWRVNLADPEPKVERRCAGFPHPDGVRMRHHLVESLGLVHLVLSDEHYNRVIVFRMDWGGSTWVWTKDLANDRMLLLGRGCSAIVPAPAARRPTPSTLLSARQPSTAIDAGAIGGGGARVWFWTELVERPNGLVALKKPSQPPEGEFNAGDSFWFFPANDPDDTCS